MKMEFSMDCGDLGEVNLIVDLIVKLKVLFFRKILIVLKDCVKVDFDKLVERGIFIFVMKLIVWVS